MSCWGDTIWYHLNFLYEVIYTSGDTINIEKLLINEIGSN